MSDKYDGLIDPKKDCWRASKPRDIRVVMSDEITALRARIAEQDAEISQWKDDYFRRHKDAADYCERALLAEAEIARLRVGHDRYETVRRMNAQQFKDAWKLNLQTGKPFDEIIDQLRPFYFASKEQP